MFFLYDEIISGNLAGHLIRLTPNKHKHVIKVDLI